MRETIRKIPAFSSLDEKLLRQLADTAITCTYKAEEVIVREGEVGVGMYFILRGRVSVFRNAGGAKVPLGEIGANEFVAEMALIDEKPRGATVMSIEETDCVLFTRDTFRQLVAKQPALLVTLVRVMTEKLRSAPEMPSSPAKTTAAAGESPAAGGAPKVTGPKAVVEQKLLDIFDMLYTVKAFTRFSVAILGCPVEGSGPDALDVIRIGDVKAVIMPADGAVELAIDAWGAGKFQLHVFHPAHFAGGQPKVMRFDPVPIQPDDRFTLSLPSAILTREPSAREVRS